MLNEKQTQLLAAIKHAEEKCRPYFDSRRHQIVAQISTPSLSVRCSGIFGRCSEKMGDHLANVLMALSNKRASEKNRLIRIDASKSDNWVRMSIVECSDDVGEAALAFDVDVFSESVASNDSSEYGVFVNFLKVSKNTFELMRIPMTAHRDVHSGSTCIVLLFPPGDD